MHSFVKSVTVTANGTQIEVQPNYTYNSYVKTLVSLSALDVPAKGSVIGFRKPDYNPPEYTAENFANIDNGTKHDIKKWKEHGFVFKAPLLLDISSVQAYLVPGVQLRIKLEMNDFDE